MGLNEVMEETKILVEEISEYLSEVPKIQIKDFQMMTIKAENLTLKIPKLLKNIENIFLDSQKKDEDSIINNSLQSKEHKISDLKFMKKCLSRIEKLESQNSKLKKKIKLQYIGLQSKHEAAKMNRNTEFFTLEKEISTLKMKNTALIEKIERLERELGLRKDYEIKRRRERRINQFCYSASPKKKIKNRLGQSMNIRTSQKKYKKGKKFKTNLGKKRRDLTKILEESAPENNVFGNKIIERRLFKEFSFSEKSEKEEEKEKVKSREEEKQIGKESFETLQEELKRIYAEKSKLKEKEEKRKVEKVELNPFKEEDSIAVSVKKIENTLSVEGSPTSGNRGVKNKMSHSHSDENLKSPRFGDNSSKGEFIRKISPSPIPKLKLSIKQSDSSEIESDLKPRFKKKNKEKTESRKISRSSKNSEMRNKIKGKIPEIEGLYYKYNEDGVVNLDYYTHKKPQEKIPRKTKKKKPKKSSQKKKTKRSTKKKKKQVSHQLDIFIEKSGLLEVTSRKMKSKTSRSSSIKSFKRPTVETGVQCHNFDKNSDPKIIEKVNKKILALAEILKNITHEEPIKKKIPFFRAFSEDVNKEVKNCLSKYLKLKKNYKQAKAMIKEYEKAIEGNLKKLSKKIQEKKFEKNLKSLNDIDKLDKKYNKKGVKKVDKGTQINSKPPKSLKRNRKNSDSLQLYNPSLNNIYSDFEDEQLSELNRSMGRSVSSFVKEENESQRRKNIKKNFGGFLNALFSQATVIENLMTGKINVSYKELNETEEMGKEGSFSAGESGNYVIRSRSSFNNDYTSGRDSNVFFN